MPARAGAAERSERARELLSWAAGLGAVTAEALAARDPTTGPGSARSRLAAAQRAGLMRRWALLRSAPALYTVTRAGLRAAGVRGIAPGTVCAGGAEHAAACCGAAVRLESAYPGHQVLGEPAIRAAVREGRERLPVPPAPAGVRSGAPRSHRPDLLLVPAPGTPGPRLAVEVELTVKSPERLEAICRGWARERSVGGAIYLAAPAVLPPLTRAVQRAAAGDRVIVVSL